VPAVRWWTGLLAGALVVAGVMVMPAVAVAQTATISEAFSPAQIAVGATSTVTFTIPSSDPTASGFTFTDSLPAGLTLTDTPSTNLGCLGTATANGSSEIDFSAPVGLGTGCTVTAQVDGLEAGNGDNPVTLTSSDPSTSTGDVYLDVVAPPTISAAFGTSLLGLDGTTPLTLTITNPNQTASLTGIGFTDSLPSSLVVGGPAGAGDTCGGTVTASTGSGSIGLSGGVLPPGASCTVVQDVIAVGTGNVTDTTSVVSSNEGGAGNATSATLELVGAPVISLLSPLSGQDYAFDQNVRASYSCTDDPSGTGISACTGTVPNGALLDTTKPGSHTFTVTATSNDGGVSSDTVFYAVAPDNLVRLGRVHAHRGGLVDFTVTVPGPGTIDVVETRPRHAAFARWRSSVDRAGKVTARIKPGPGGRATLDRRRTLRVTVSVTFTPRGGNAKTTSFRVELSS